MSTSEMVYIVQYVFVPIWVTRAASCFGLKPMGFNWATLNFDMCNRCKFWMLCGFWSLVLHYNSTCCCCNV